MYINQLFLLEQHSESFKMWAALIRINTEGKSFFTKLGSGETQVNNGERISTARWFLPHDQIVTFDWIWTVT